MQAQLVHVSASGIAAPKVDQAAGKCQQLPPQQSEMASAHLSAAHFHRLQLFKPAKMPDVYACKRYDDTLQMQSAQERLV